MDKLTGLPAPTIAIIFGATGDLMARKILPALYNLYESDQCPEMFKVVGFARRDLGDKVFKENVVSALKAKNKKASSEFMDIFSYTQGDFNSQSGYQKLAADLQEIDDNWGVCTNKLFYLAVPPEYYETIFENLAKSGLTKPCSDETGWTKVLVEKPFGKNLQHAIALDKQLNELFKDEQVYRVDHYLAKDAVQNILNFRFSNNFLEANWDRKGIERIDIKLHETIDTEGRGFYDSVGALLDVGQNHLLQMLALVTMDQPEDYSANSIREKRAEILESLKPIKDITHNTVRAQYDGYKKEAEVDKKSTTETYFKLRTELDHPNWRGVPIFMEAGKAIAKEDKAVVLTYRHSVPCLCPEGVHYKNQLHIDIGTHPSIAVKFWVKKPGSKNELKEEWLKFDYALNESARYEAEYTQLLKDAIMNERTLFVSSRETLASWAFIDPIIESWRAGDTELHNYKKHSSIEEIADKLEHVKPGRVGIYGLGKMGMGLGLKLQDAGWHVFGYNRTPPTHAELFLVDSPDELLAKLPSPKVVWLMVTHSAVDEVIFGEKGLASKLKKGDIIIDGGNSFYKDSVERSKKLAEKGIKFVDVGVSGGPYGARNAPCLMIGGDRETFEKLEKLFSDLAYPKGSYQFFEGAGAGHFVKMVHNGIEYGMMQAIAEGYTILKESKYNLDLTGVTDIYSNGSVIESRLVTWLGKAFKLHTEDLMNVSGSVDATGEGAWTVKTAIEMGIKAKIIEESLNFRSQSKTNPSYTGRVLSALREQFGGHKV